MLHLNRLRDRIDLAYAGDPTSPAATCEHLFGDRFVVSDNRAVARLADRLDAERLAIAQAFGLSLPTLQQHYQKSYDVPFGPLEDMAQAIHERGMGPDGPASLTHRYVVEDAPFGLAFQEALGRLAKVPTPTLSSALTILEAVYDTDWRRHNFLPDALGLASMSAAELRARCQPDATGVGR